MTVNLPDCVRARPRSRIVCTLGPSTESADSIRQLIEAGMSVARINTSHATLDSHRRCIETVRDVSGSMGIPVGILADLPGPKYRLGQIPGGGIDIVESQTVFLNGDDTAGASGSVPVHPPGLHRDVRVGDDILVNDGAIRLVATAVSGPSIECTVAIGGYMESRKAVAVPARTSTLPYLTEDTENALEFAISEKVDFIGLSYIRSAEDIRAARSFVDDRSSGTQLIAKIELREGLDNLEEIIEATDGVMVARGDLGVELPLAQVPGAQKLIIRKANEVGKVVITATQMLESMIVSPTPTRAEITDIYNAVVDGSDAIMLSAETSIGKHPVEAVKVMAEAAIEAEKSIDRHALESRWEALEKSIDRAMAYTACWTAADQGSKAIIAFTESGRTAARVSSFRPAAPILALYRDPSAGRRLSLRWGIIPIEVPAFSSIQWMFHEGSRIALETGYANEGDSVILVAGMPIGASGNTNLVRVIVLPEPEPRFERERFNDLLVQE